MNCQKCRKTRKIIGAVIGATTKKEDLLWQLTITLWVKPKTMETVKEMYKIDDYRSQSEFIEKTIHTYVGYLRADNSPGMLPNYMVFTMKAIVDSSTTSQNRMLFKLAVEMAIMMNILAAHCEIKEKSLSTLRQSCIDEVKRINGTLGFEDAYYWQKG